MDGGGFREWLAGLGRREMVILALVGLGVLGGATVWFVRSLPRAVTIEGTSGSTEPTVGPTPTAAAVVVVHVAGWVRRPGVYELRVGHRVIDAVEQAGGPRRGADLDALNLAALLVDGQQIVVPRRGHAPAQSPGEGAGPGESPLVNLNVATATELEALPGIGPVLAQRIVDFREENGPFASVDDLLDVSGIGEKTLEGFRDLVTV